MKHNHLLFILAASTLLTSAPMKAQTKKSDKIQTELIFPENKSYETRNFGNETLCLPVQTTVAPRKDNMVKITLKGISDAGIQPTAGGIYNNDFKQNIWIEKGNEQEIEVPQGTYDMFLQFRKGTSYYVFKENIEVHDGDVIEFNQAEAVNDVTFKFYDESDKELFMDLYDGATLVEAGNADNMTKITSFNNKEYGTLATSISKGYMPMQYQMEFYVNDLSDRYVISNGTNIIANGITYTYKGVVNTPAPSTLLELGGESLKECTTTIDAPDLMDNVDDSFVQGYTFTVLFDGLAIVGERGYISKNIRADKTVINLMSCPESDDPAGDLVNVIYQPALSNYYEISDKKKKFFGVRACAMVGDSNGIKYVNAGQDADWGGQNVPAGKKATQYYPGHPDFSYQNEDGTMTVANSCPAIAIRSRRYKKNNDVNGWNTPIFTGRYGERYESDAYLLEIDEQEMEDGKTLGRIVDEMVMVDGTPGKNTTEYIVDLDGDDFIAPTLQMLTFKNADGTITDRLENAKGSKLIFTGGDFEYNYNKDVARSYYSCSSAEVEVSYSPRGEEQWTKLVVNEIPEKKFMPYFGNFYEVALDDIKSENDNQWFDLQISFKDAAGNSQKQTMSPAFMIKSSKDTGIDDITATKAILTMMGNSVRMSVGGTASFEILGIDGCSVRTAVGNEISVEGLPSGIYLVKAETDGYGILTKKIMVN